MTPHIAEGLMTLGCFLVGVSLGYIITSRRHQASMIVAALLLLGLAAYVATLLWHQLWPY